MPTLPQPDPLPLPAPVWLLWVLLTLTFVLHVLPMNLVLGGSIIGLVSRLRARRHPPAAALAGLVAHALPPLVATAVTMGVAALLFLQVLFGRLFFPAAVLMAVPWLAVVPVLIVGYYATYAGRSSTRTVFAWTAAALFCVIAFVYANAMGLMLRPAEFLPRFQASANGLHLNLGDPTLVPRFLHVLLGALAVSGLAVAVAGTLRRRDDPATGEWMARHGVAWCAAATILNFLPGFWWLAALPRETLLMFLGHDPAAAAVFTFGLLAGLAAIALAVPAGFSAQAPRGLIVASAAALTLAVVLMVIVRDMARTSILRANGFELPARVSPQWSAIAIFAVLLLAAAVTVWWMVGRLVRGAQRQGKSAPV